MYYKYLFNKIVRSFCIDKDIEQKKLLVSYKKLDDESLKSELLKKLKEEAEEVCVADNRSELIEEIADVYEVIDAILAANTIDKNEILHAQAAKRLVRGDFYAGYFIDHIEYDDQNPLHHSSLAYVDDKKDGDKYKLIGKYDFHVVDCIIRNEKNEIYVQKRSNTRADYPDKWELVGGKIETGENFRDAIKRELREETNLDLKDIVGLVHQGEYLVRGKNFSYSVFEISVENWTNFKLEDGKASEYQWIGIDKIDILKKTEEDISESPVYTAAKKFYGI
jgi:mutator protein MutT